jgi:hypothetical protein
MNQSINIEENDIRKADFTLVESQQHKRKTTGIKIHHGRKKPRENEIISISKNRIIYFLF